VFIGSLLYLALMLTRHGTAIRAVAVDPVAAQLVAIDVRSTRAFAFALGGALAAAGGVLIAMFTTFTAAMGVVFTMKRSSSSSWAASATSRARCLRA
jgi:branched-chain amino acid transport system permease protein